MRGGLVTGHAAFDGFQHFVADIVADILFGLGTLIGDTGSFRKSDGARQTDVATRGGLATRHAALDGFQHFVAHTLQSPLSSAPMRAARSFGSAQASIM